MTFSIVAYDPAEESWGVGVASKFLGVGGIVNWAQAGAGAVATQSFCNVSFGPDGVPNVNSDKWVWLTGTEAQPHTAGVDASIGQAISVAKGLAVRGIF